LPSRALPNWDPNAEFFLVVFIIRIFSSTLVLAVRLYVVGGGDGGGQSYHEYDHDYDYA